MWSTIKGALFEDSAPAPLAPAAQPQATPGQAVTPTAATPAPNNEFIVALRQAIKARQTAFTNLLAAADKLASIIPDPATRLKAAFATVGEGRSPREVIDAIAVHIADLEGQKLQFSRAVETQRAAAIGQLQAELDNAKTSSETAQSQIASMTQQIAQLQQLIATNTTRAGELQAQLTSESARFTTSTQQFEAALIIVKQELEGQKAAVLSTLA